MSRYRHPALAILLAGVLPLTAACGTGFDATTQKYYAPADGVLKVQGHIRILNLMVVGPPEGSRDATISTAIANDDVLPDTVTEITAETGQAEIQGPRDIPAQGTLAFGSASAESSAVIRNFTAPVGGSVRLTFRFARNSAIEVATVVVPSTGYYEGFVVTPSAGASMPENVPGETPSAENAQTGSPGPNPGVPAPAPGGGLPSGTESRP